MWTLTRLRLFCATSAAAIAVVGPATAQSTVSGDKVEAVEAQINAPVSRNKLEALEAQINALQQELRDLKGKVNKTNRRHKKPMRLTHRRPRLRRQHQPRPLP